MQILHGFRRIVQATSLAVFFVLFSTNAFAYEIMPIFNWSAEIDGGTVSGVARCGPGSGSTSTSAKSWSTSNWNLQNKGCFCRARDIASVDWTDVPLEYASSTEAQRSYWYGSGGSNSMYPLNSLEECEANCADKCAALFASNSSYRNNLCGGDCQIDQGETPVTTYTITYNLNGGTGCSNTTYTDSTTLCEPTRDGYTFGGWATTDGGATVYNANANVSGTDLTLYANWTQISYTITYNLNGGTGCSNGSYTINDDITLCEPTRDGYDFDGWFINSGLTGNAIATIESGSTGNREYWAKWIEYKFQLTTTQMDANDTFKWMMSAAGTFYVDCGDNGVLSGTGVSGNTITRSDTTAAQYTCTYPTGGTHTIRMGGSANGYNATDDSSGSYAAIGFSTQNYSNNTPTKIAGISGSLGAIFGTIGNGNTLATQPRFMRTFYNATNMAGSIPSNLFTGITGAPASSMFYQTFQNCNKLSGQIPATLFAGIHGAPAQYMFSGTFGGCSGLSGQIPATLFAGIHGVPAQYMFSSTFSGCSGLTGTIPSTLFCQDTNNPNTNNCI